MHLCTLVKMWIYIKAILCLLVLFTLPTQKSCQTNQTEITIGVLLASRVMGYKIFLPPFLIGLDNIRTSVQKGLLLPVTYKYVFETTSTYCSRTVMHAPGVAVDLFTKQDIQAFFGPVCSRETLPVADLATHWNIPILTPLSADHDLDSKIRFQTLTRMSYIASSVVNFLLAICNRIEWKAVATIKDKTSKKQGVEIVAEAISKILSNADISVHQVDMFGTGSGSEALTKAISRGRSKWYCT